MTDIPQYKLPEQKQENPSVESGDDSAEKKRREDDDSRLALATAIMAANIS